MGFPLRALTFNSGLKHDPRSVKFSKDFYLVLRFAVFTLLSLQCLLPAGFAVAYPGSEVREGTGGLVDGSPQQGLGVEPW